MQTIKLADFLTVEQVDKCVEIAKANPDYEWARKIDEDVILPNLKTIEKKLGQECNSRYLAYCVVYAMVVAASRTR